MRGRTSRWSCLAPCRGSRKDPSAAFAKPELYELLEAEGIGYAIRLPADRVLRERIGRLLTRPVGRPPRKPRAVHASRGYRVRGWSRPRRAVAKVEWHRGEPCPRAWSIVTGPTRPAGRVIKPCNGRGTAERRIREGKNAPRWARLPCRAFRDNAARLRLLALAHNLADLPRGPAPPDEVTRRPLTTSGERVVSQFEMFL